MLCFCFVSFFLFLLVFNEVKGIFNVFLASEQEHMHINGGFYLVQDAGLIRVLGLSKPAAVLLSRILILLLLLPLGPMRLSLLKYPGGALVM